MSSDSNTFRTAINISLDYMNKNPEKLEEHPTEMIDRLIGYMETNGQSSANEVKAHEACIAVVFEANGFKLAQRNVVPPEAGFYYWYQPAGSQKSGDFLLFRVEDGKKEEVLFDAKHTSNTTIKLNDGWFNKDTIYIISFSESIGRSLRKKICFIGLGQDIPTDKDIPANDECNRLKKEWNTMRKNIETDYLSIYFRLANGYSTKQFTHEFISDRFQKTVSWILPSAE